MKYFFWLFLCLLVLSQPRDAFQIDYILEIKEESSAIEGVEDLMGRSEYFRLLTADPSTGEIPLNIRKAEIAFVKNQARSLSQSRVQELGFETQGPSNVGGRTRAVAFDIRNENVILAGGVSGGVWKSLDGGLTWTRKSDPENRNSVTCIVQDIRPGKEDTWYHGTGEIVGNSARGGNAPFRGDGIYKSTDNGETWNLLTSTQDSNPSDFNSQFQYIWNIEINPENLVDDEILVAAFGAILKSLDGGDTWEVTLGQKLFDLDDTVDLNSSNASFYTSLERSESNVYYAALSTEGPLERRSPEAGLYYSLDGENWEDITPLTDESTYRRVVIGSSPSNPAVTYFMLDSNPIFILEHSLTQLDNPGRVNGFDPQIRVVPDFEEELGDLNTQGSYNMTLRVHPDDQNIVFVGGTNLYRSTDGFKTKESIDWIGGYNPEGGASLYPNHHPDQHDLLFLPSDPDVALSANDGGLYISQNIQADSIIWEDRNNGYITSQFFTISQGEESGSNFVIGGMQDNGTYLTNASPSWQSILGGDGGYAAVTKNKNLLYISFQRGQTLRVSVNEQFDITSFSRVDPGSLVAQSGSQYLFINPFVLDPTNQNRMFCAGGNHLYYHPNVSQIPGGSQTPTSLGWKKVNETSLPQGVVSAVSISSDGDRVYFGSSDSDLFRIDNANEELLFDLVDISSGALPENSYISSIAVNPEDDDHIVVVFSNYNVPSIFESKDGGETFIDISGSLEENVDGSGSGPSVRWVEIIPRNSEDLIVVGTSVGLYSKEAGTNFPITWKKEASNLIGNAIITMMDYRASDGKLIVATHGNGVFKTTIPSFKQILPEGEEASGFELVAAYPNPFIETTEIQYVIPEDGDVRIDILSSDGRLINTLLWGLQFAGNNSVVWTGQTSSGVSLANGVYFYRISYQGQNLSGRLLLKR